MIDPNFWSDDKIIELEPEQRLLFIGMWNFADDKGIVKYSSKQLKAQIFPADNITHGVINEWLMRICEIGLILFNEDRSLIKIKGWSNYQKINRPTPSNYEFVEGDSVSAHGTLTTNRREKKGIEKKRIEKKPSNQTSSEFDCFYELYPRKVSKKATIRAFNRLSKKDVEAIMVALPKHIKHWQDKAIEMDYIPHPSTWLNQEKWKDALTTGSLTGGVDNGEADYKKTQDMIQRLRAKQSGAATPEEAQAIIAGVTDKLRANR